LVPRWPGIFINPDSEATRENNKKWRVSFAWALGCSFESKEGDQVRFAIGGTIGTIAPRPRLVPAPAPPD
jgi:hypothetical protein